jgi:hypothetical protein
MGTRPTRAVAKTLHYCETCLKQTTHEIHQTSDAETANCVPCMERTVSYELDRE